ncbi:putative lycopene cyclase [Actinacidiphila reveromycinica]|uniref:Putative lycopene cyclase n=1 Tax=Actinacidiphila reveromycinica TaxID=659352 RepID=A0A7U3UMS7_9ACTN|nr:lycopene cyclase family protein [Streptomyces sp. SN-593]BBA95432.1 putative lycopene cyclase [Streptomyces sp. SN-593]
MGFDADVLIVGAGAAGLSLAHRLADPSFRGRLEVLLVDAPPGALRPPERTFCYWEPPGGEYDDVLAACWDRLRVTGARGPATTVRTGPLRYKMLDSRAFEAFAARRLAAAPWVRRSVARVRDVADAPGGARVAGLDERGRPAVWHARWVFDSRPPDTPPRARTTLLQHFRGWFVRCDRPVFDPRVAELMDFRTPRPRHGLSFGYVLPLGARNALVEYTEFSPAVLDGAGYTRALRHYTGEVLRLPPFRVVRAEQGVIPMSDARPARRAGACVFRIGAAGGATRPATGYTFAAVQRQSRAVAAALAEGRTPLPPPAYPPRALAMDAVMLRALATGRVDGGDFFTGLFAGVPADRLLRFLDGRTRLREDVSVGLRTPVLPMLRTALELPLLRRRPPAGSRGGRGPYGAAPRVAVAPGARPTDEENDS